MKNSLLGLYFLYLFVIIAPVGIHHYQHYPSPSVTRLQPDGDLYTNGQTANYTILYRRSQVSRRFRLSIPHESVCNSRWVQSPETSSFVAVCLRYEARQINYTINHLKYHRTVCGGYIVTRLVGNGTICSLD